MSAGHGTRPRYQAGCHCDRCRHANAAYIEEWRTGYLRSEQADRDRREVQRRLAAVSRYLAGESSTEVAALFGVAPSRVRAWVRAEGHELRPKQARSKPGWVDDAAGRHLAGEPIADLARRYGVRYRQVQYHLVKLGVVPPPRSLADKAPGPAETAVPVELVTGQPVAGWEPPTAAQIAVYEPVDGWEGDARCRGLDPNLFHPERGAPTRETKAVCSGCPVALDCATFAVRNGEKHGIWGGLSEKQRRQIRRQLRLEEAAA